MLSKRLGRESIPWAWAKIALGVVKSSKLTQARLLQLQVQPIAGLSGYSQQAHTQTHAGTAHL